jgi:hypothetical protein
MTSDFAGGTAVNTEAKSRRWPKRLLKACLWTGGVLVLLWVCMFFRATWELNQVVAAMRAKDEPTNFEEIIDKNCRSAGSATGATLIRKAVAEHHRVGRPGNRLSMEPGLIQIPIPKDRLPQIEEWLSQGAAILPIIEKAVALPPGPLAVVRDDDLDLEFCQNMRELSRLLAAEARYAISQGDKARALKRLKSHYLLTEQLAADQIVIPQLIRIALLGVVSEPNRVALESLDFTPDELDELCALIGKVEANLRFEASLRNERAAAAVHFQSPKNWADSVGARANAAAKGTPTSSYRAWSIAEWQWARLVSSPVGLPTRLRAAAEALQMPDDVCSLVDLPNPLPEETAKLLERHRSTLDVERLGLNEPTSTAIGVLLRAGLLARQRLDLTRIMLRVRRYYVVNGKLPVKLDDVCGGPLPTIPAKWFEGKQPDYVHEKGEVFLSASATRYKAKMRPVKK